MPEYHRWQEKREVTAEECRLISEEEKKRLLEKSEISLWLDSYDDIFSDFDPRPYTHKALSADFLEEARRASRDKDIDGIELKLLVPMHKRNHTHEILIKNRLHEHFKKHHSMMHKEVKSIYYRGLIFIFAGSSMMLTGAYLHMIQLNAFLNSLLFVIVEPGGWFLLWTGLDHVINLPHQKDPDLEFYEKMSKCKISFSSI